ncbi:hypothetical protein DAPPUDRAFT_249295 [Daphnia pulex]|uniref:Uncharacterized protein n=1 Tax=Daphnia pulex TaxID=6669 RepID=E9GWC9_DAPPU|nr:hypothetical protein DAPPUDRAFT_249295 [Daphnia pulex]|eukprot:EFX76082.1 hypothetical protein DAPPUDRAFT_249295 [Daphnia pulex]
MKTFRPYPFLPQLEHQPMHALTRTRSVSANFEATPNAREPNNVKISSQQRCQKNSQQSCQKPPKACGGSYAGAC